MTKCVLQAPSAHALVECLKELKFGRPAEQQLVLDEAVNFVTASSWQRRTRTPRFLPIEYSPDRIFPDKGGLDA